MPASPSVQNYHIGKGIVSFKRDGAPDFVDLGNAPTFEWAPTVEKLEHFSAREGVKVKDFTAVTQTGATITMSLDEITGENLSIFTLGEVGVDTNGDVTVAAFKSTEVGGEIKVVGTNDIGQQVDYTGRISVVPSGSFSFITSEDEFSVLEIEAEVQKGDDGNFGIFTVRDANVSA
jgi:hypothetical protein